MTPVSGVLFGGSVDQEYRVDQMRLYSKDKFMRIRRYNLQFGPRKITEVIASWINNAKVVGILEVCGDPTELRQECHLLIKDELNLLASARLGTSKRTRRVIIGPAGSSDQYDTMDAFIGRDVDLMSGSFSRITHDYLQITQEFLGRAATHFFPHLLKMIREESALPTDWKNLLRSVGILIGKSQNSVEAADAFLWNMIALEQLLLLDKERQGHLDLLVLRIKALLGYCPFWIKNKMEDRIRLLYKLRCKLVHEGCRNGVDIQTVITTDELLRNVLTAITQNKTHFKSKSDIIETGYAVDSTNH